MTKQKAYTITEAIKAGGLLFDSEEQMWKAMIKRVRHGSQVRFKKAHNGQIVAIEERRVRINSTTTVQQEIKHEVR